eukprot:tig00001094_g7007.t1
MHEVLPLTTRTRARQSSFEDRLASKEDMLEGLTGRWLASLSSFNSIYANACSLLSSIGTSSAWAPLRVPKRRRSSAPLDAALAAENAAKQHSEHALNQRIENAFCDDTATISPPRNAAIAARTAASPGSRPPLSRLQLLEDKENLYPSSSTIHQYVKRPRSLSLPGMGESSQGDQPPELLRTSQPLTASQGPPHAFSQPALPDSDLDGSLFSDSGTAFLVPPREADDGACDIEILISTSSPPEGPSPPHALSSPRPSGQQHAQPSPPSSLARLGISSASEPQATPSQRPPPFEPLARMQAPSPVSPCVEAGNRLEGSGRRPQRGVGEPFGPPQRWPAVDATPSPCGARHPAAFPPSPAVGTPALHGAAPGADAGWEITPERPVVGFDPVPECRPLGCGAAAEPAALDFSAGAAGAGGGALEEEVESLRGEEVEAEEAFLGLAPDAARPEPHSFRTLADPDTARPFAFPVYRERDVLTWSDACPRPFRNARDEFDFDDDCPTSDGQWRTSHGTVRKALERALLDVAADPFMRGVLGSAQRRLREVRQWSVEYHYTRAERDEFADDDE